MTLRQYQTEIAEQAAELLRQYKIAYLAMQVRTGKTITAMETCKLYGASVVLFVTKKKAIGSIEADYLPNYKKHFTMFCVNYEQLHNLPMVRYDVIILDEAHCLGQYPQPANRTEELKKLAVNTPIIYLSGTPTPESHSQLYHQLWVSSYSPFANYRNFYGWAADYVVKGVKYLYNRQINDYSNAIVRKVDEATRHLFISYTQDQAGFESPVEEHFHTIKMSERTYQVIDKLKRNKIITFSPSGLIVEADTEVKLMGKIHQLCSGTVITEQKAITFDTSKIKYINEHFIHRKIAIFYKFAEERDMIIKGLAINITEDPQTFNNTYTTVAFISQIQSGREGINLSSADCLIMLNIDFSAVSYWQSRARLQTQTRTKPAEVHWLFSENGIEQRIYDVVQRKKDFTLHYFKKTYL